MAKTAKKDAVKKIEKAVPVVKVVEKEPEPVEAEKGGIQKVGVISTIVESLKAGWTTKAAILETLTKKFPDRKADGMKSTVSIQLGPTRLATKHKLVKDGDKYRIEG